MIINGLKKFLKISMSSKEAQRFLRLRKPSHFELRRRMSRDRAEVLGMDSIWEWNKPPVEDLPKIS